VAKDWKPWAGAVATQAIGQALGTLLAAGVVVLAGAAFGFFSGFSKGELIALGLVLVTAAVAMAGFINASRSLAEVLEAREREFEARQRELEAEMEETRQAVEAARERERELDERLERILEDMPRREPE
jgi:outer membrane murein-binding lipoprotein Lpp